MRSYSTHRRPGPVSWHGVNSGRDAGSIITRVVSAWIPAFAGMTMFLFSVFLNATEASAAPLRVVATFSILGDMAHTIGGGHIDLKVLVGPDSDVHVYEPTPADIKTLASADLLIVNGLGLEPWLDRLVKTSGYTGQIVIATKSIAPLTIGSTSEPDPHAWQDIANGKIYIGNIGTSLMEKDPDHLVDYMHNGVRYATTLDALDSWVKDEIAKVPPGKRKLITSHDAFRYFAHAYGVTMIAPQGVSTESSISAGDIAHLIDQMRKEHIKALFLENMTDNRLMKQLESDGGATIGGTLYSDALSAPNGPASNYTQMFQHNVTQMVAGMQHNQ